MDGRGCVLFGGREGAPGKIRLVNKQNTGLILKNDKRKRTKRIVELVEETEGFSIINGA